MKHSLQLKLSQHLTLTPQLQQSIRLLQLSTVELNQEVERFLQENPLLEREDETPEEVRVYTAPGATPTETKTNETAEEAPAPSQASDGVDWLDGEGFGGGGSHADGEESDYPQIAADSAGLRDHLLWQLNVSQLPERDKRLVTLLIDSLDDDGYLTLALEEIAVMIPEELEVDPVELQIARNYLRTFDPPGVGARNLSECLAFQLTALPKDTPHLDAAIMTVTQHLDSLASRDYAKLKKFLQCDDEALREIQQLILSLNPKPGAGFSSEQARYVVPDVVVKKVKGMWRASLHPDAMPKLRINRVYADILVRNRGSGYQQLSGQLQEAKWLIKNVQQRFDTILRVSQAIVDRQRHFFEHGEVAMRPLVLREIAETLGLHESTVSRVTTQKFMLTPRGIFELKYFFGSHVGTDSGGACSATAIRALIKQLVGAEDAKRPLSDSQISEILGQQGITVARRTIAKYREALQIPPVNLRKCI
ncbi:MAG: RNA polymerase factor sigma-54 [Burkholderiales bacterium]